MHEADMIKIIIQIYLLLKSAFKRRFTWFDIGLARAFVDPVLLPGLMELKLKPVNIPGWLWMIMNMQQSTEMPEAFGLFLAEAQADIEAWLQDWLED